MTQRTIGRFLTIVVNTVALLAGVTVLLPAPAQVLVLPLGATLFAAAAPFPRRRLR